MLIGDVLTIGKEWFVQKWKDSDSRNRMILVFLVFVLIVVIVVKIPGPQIVPHLRVLKCENCGHEEIRLFVELKEVECGECAGEMGYAFKCLECDYEFPYAPREIFNPDQYSEKELREMRIMYKICPNCGSRETFPIPGPLFKHWQKHGRGVGAKGIRTQNE